MPTPGAEIERDPAAGLVDDPVDRGQPEPGALARRLGREERLEDARLGLGVHPAAGVGHRQPRAPVLHLNAHGQPAAGGHRVARVDHEVHEHLLEPPRVAVEQHRAPAGLDHQRDVLVDQPLEHRLQPGDELAEVEELAARRLAAAEAQQLLGQPLRALGRALDLGQVLAPLAIVQARTEQPGVADDRRQHVVEVVRDAAGELADRLHLLRLQQVRLELPAVGDVDHQPAQRPGPRGHPHAVAQPQRAPVGGDDAVLELVVGAGGDRLGGAREHLVAIGRVEHARPRAVALGQSARG